MLLPRLDAQVLGTNASELPLSNVLLDAQADASVYPPAFRKFVQSEMLGRFGRQPTPDQARAITGITQLLRSAIPMRAMLSADVGCGKSLVFWAPVLAAVRGGI